MIRIFVGIVLGCLALPLLAQAQSPAGHAHNDYEHARPLLDALAYGFTSVEVDIWLVEGALLVGHDLADLEPGMTLQRLYLAPLRRLVEEHHPEASSITLLIDIKTDGEATYRVLSEVLSEYADILAVVKDGVRIPGAVTAVVSGNRPRAAMAADDPRYAFYDGRLSDLESGMPADFMPLVSDNWTKHFSWTGAGEVPAGELDKLAGIVASARVEGYAVRFWGTPDQPGPERDSLWRALTDAGVDFINTNDLEGFAQFRDGLR